MEKFLAEDKALKIVAGPVDLNTAAVTGARVNMKDQKRCAFVVQMGTSTAATVQFTLRQHNAATSGTSKDLSVENVYYRKSGAATTFTKVEPTVAAATYDLSTTFAADGGIVVFEVLEEDLDANGGFAWVSLDIADSGAAKLGTVLAVCDGGYQPAYGEAI
jgi:hypothetical protein